MGVITLRARLLLVSAVLTVAVVETLSFGGLAIARRIRSRLIWSPDGARFESGYMQFLAARDPILGWPALVADANRARRSPAFPDSARACVALFGDSFTYGSEVPDEEAWGNVLARRMQCRVANYGVGGYGTDQAFLRYRDRATDHAPIVILGIFEDNVQRNVNRYRALLAGSPAFSFKPRFKLGDRGELELLPMALPDRRDERGFIESPEDFLSDEYFLPGSAAGPVRPRFPFTLSLVRLLAHPDVRAVLGGHPYWERYYQPGHASGALETTVGIVREIQREATARGQRLVVSIFPSPKTVLKVRPGGNRPYRNLIDRIRALGIPVVDLADGLTARLARRSPCEIATHPDASRGHYDVEGNAWVGETLAQTLVRTGWLKSAVALE